MTGISYKELQNQVSALIQDVPYFIANVANISALLFQHLEDVNWVGFYIVKNKSLILGPFQGKPACIEIPFGKGVCGIAAKDGATLVVPDVHVFDGHIACDSDSNSEIVIPVHFDGKVIGVLDIDSPLFSRFTKEDQIGLEGIVERLEEELLTQRSNAETCI